MAMTASEARKNLFPLIEQVNNDRQPVEITSKHGDHVHVAGRLRRPRRDCLSPWLQPTHVACSKALSKLAPESARCTTCCSATGLHAARLVRLSPLAVGRHEDGEADQPAARGHSARSLFRDRQARAAATRAAGQLVQADRRRASSRVPGGRRRHRRPAGSVPLRVLSSSTATHGRPQIFGQ